MIAHTAADAARCAVTEAPAAAVLIVRQMEDDPLAVALSLRSARVGRDLPLLVLVPPTMPVEQLVPVCRLGGVDVATDPQAPAMLAMRVALLASLRRASQKPAAPGTPRAPSTGCSSGPSPRAPAPNKPEDGRRSWPT
ncbi:MAG: hypothetical protein R3F14_02640 [Polyangiaceae bacterium]